MLAGTDQELQEFQRNVTLQRQLGVEAYLLTPDEAKKLVPQLNVEDTPGASYCPTDGYADPYSLVQGFLSASKRLGVKVYEDIEVTGITASKGKIRGVNTTDGKISAPIVVNAAGAYASQVGKMIGVNLPVHPTRRHLFVTAPVEAFRKDCPMVVDFHTGFWFRREGQALIFGMRNPDEPEGLDISVDWSWLRAMAPTASHRLPLLDSLGISRAQAGLHPDTSDNNAIMGKVPDLDGLVCACGFGGHGFMHAPAAGKTVAELILEGQASSVDIAALALTRFAAGHCREEQCFI